MYNEASWQYSDYTQRAPLQRAGHPTGTTGRLTMETEYSLMPAHPPSGTSTTPPENLDVIELADQLGLRGVPGRRYFTPWEPICAPDSPLANLTDQLRPARTCCLPSGSSWPTCLFRPPRPGSVHARRGRQRHPVSQTWTGKNGEYQQMTGKRWRSCCASDRGRASWEYAESTGTPTNAPSMFEGLRRLPHQVVPEAPPPTSLAQRRPETSLPANGVTSP